MAMDIAKTVFEDREFTTAEMWEKLKERWTFKLSRGRIFNVLKRLMQKGRLTGRKEHLDRFGWSVQHYRWVWRAD